MDDVCCVGRRLRVGHDLLVRVPPYAVRRYGDVSFQQRCPVQLPCLGGAEAGSPAQAVCSLMLGVGLKMGKVRAC